MVITLIVVDVVTIVGIRAVIIVIQYIIMITVIAYSNIHLVVISL